MARVIDLGNGYGRVEGYGSPYASLTFPLTLYGVRRLHAEGYLSRDELQQTLLDRGYSEKEAAWLVALASVTVGRWKDRLNGYRTI